jgi:hypothetical protein
MRLDDFCAVQVGYRPCQLEDAVESAGAELKLGHGRFD